MPLDHLTLWSPHVKFKGFGKPFFGFQSNDGWWLDEQFGGRGECGSVLMSVRDLDWSSEIPRSGNKGFCTISLMRDILTWASAWVCYAMLYGPSSSADVLLGIQWGLAFAPTGGPPVVGIWGIVGSRYEPPMFKISSPSTCCPLV